MQCILFKTSIILQPYKSDSLNIITLHFLFSNIEIMYILCVVIPTKADTSQVPQQNVN